jgi:hypothetical protein
MIGQLIHSQIWLLSKIYKCRELSYKYKLIFYSLHNFLKAFLMNFIDALHDFLKALLISFLMHSMIFLKALLVQNCASVEFSSIDFGNINFVIFLIVYSLLFYSLKCVLN